MQFLVFDHKPEDGDGLGETFEAESRDGAAIEWYKADDDGSGNTGVVYVVEADEPVSGASRFEVSCEIHYTYRARAR